MEKNSGPGERPVEMVKKKFEIVQMVLEIVI